MKETVAHFVRKYSQLKASFIKNQLEHHVAFNPVVVCKIDKHKRVGGFADTVNFDLTKLDLSMHFNLLAKLKFKILKLISKQDIYTINSFLQNHDVKVLHFHYGTDAGIYLPFLKKNKIPSVVSFYGYECSGFPGYMGGYGKRYLQNRVFPYIDKVLAMSPDMKNDLIKIGCPKEKIIVHHHGNDVKRFYMERDYSAKKQTVDFLIISGLTPQKGHFFLLESFKKALEKNKKIRLTIVGDGILRKKISEFIAKSNLLDYVSFENSVIYGSIKHLEYLKKHDIFIHPSITDVNGDKEGIPGAIVEAMAAGLPIISTNHAGIPYIIENRTNGLLVDEFDYHALTEAIIELADNELLREKFGRAGQKFAGEHLDIHIREKELEKIYHEILNR